MALLRRMLRQPGSRCFPLQFHLAVGNTEFETVRPPPGLQLAKVAAASVHRAMPTHGRTTLAAGNGRGKACGLAFGARGQVGPRPLNVEWPLQLAGGI